MGLTLRIETPAVFQPLLVPSRYKGAHGGRGSGKSYFFGELLVEDCVRAPGEAAGEGMLAVCIREVQKTLADSSKRLVEKKIAQLGLGSEFKVFRDRIETPGDGVITFRGMQDHTAESIKRLEGFRRAWIDERRRSRRGRYRSCARPCALQAPRYGRVGTRPGRATLSMISCERASLTTQPLWRRIGVITPSGRQSLRPNGG